MSIPRSIESSLSRSADALVRAAIRRIDQWLRQGRTLEEILDALRGFDLPATEAARLRDAVAKAFKDITAERAGVVKELRSSTIDRIAAASQISYPELESGVRRSLVSSVQRAIASRMGPEALMHRLKRQGIEHPKTLAFTSIAQFNNGLTFQTAAITGTFLYSGPIAASSRLFCREHVGKVFTLEQIGQMDNGQGLPVLTSCGGYNCRHEWVAEPDGSARQGLKTVEIGKMTLLLSPSESQTLLSKVAKHTA